MDGRWKIKEGRSKIPAGLGLFYQWHQQMQTSRFSLLARDWASKEGIEVSDASWLRLEQYQEVLALFAGSTNLVGSAKARDFFLGHVCDSLFLLKAIPEGYSVVDVGSGAGLPGLVIACVRPDIEVELVEPRHRRVAFLVEAARRLGLGKLSVTKGRFPQVPGSCRPPVVRVSRATFQPERWLDLALSVSVGEDLVLVMMSARQGNDLVDAARLAGSQEFEGQWWRYRLADGRDRVLFRTGSRIGQGGRRGLLT